MNGVVYAAMRSRPESEVETTSNTVNHSKWTKLLLSEEELSSQELDIKVAGLRGFCQSNQVHFLEKISNHTRHKLTTNIVLITPGHSEESVTKTFESLMICFTKKGVLKAVCKQLSWVREQNKVLKEGQLKLGDRLERWEGVSSHPFQWKHTQKGHNSHWLSQLIVE